MPCSGLRVIWLFFAGIVAANLMRGIVIKGYGDLPADLRKSRQRSRRDVGRYQRQSDCRSIVVPLAGSAAAGGRLSDVAKPTEYVRDLRYFPAYNRIRNQFFPEPPASTVVRVLELLKV